MLSLLEDILRALSGTGAWGQIDATTHGTLGTAKKFTATATLCRKAIIRTADTGNTAAITIGPTVSATLVPLPAGGVEYVIEAPLGRQFDLSTWYSISTAATQSFKVLYFA